MSTDITRSALGTWRCSDCNAVAQDRDLYHDPTCPFIRGLNETSDDDRLWFEQHPGESVRHRPPTWAEKVELRAQCRDEGKHVPDGLDFGGEVQVTKIGPGLRARQFGRVYAVLPIGNHGSIGGGR